MVEVQEKVCCRCGETKSNSAFRVKQYTPGRKYLCNECRSAYKQAWIKGHRDIVRVQDCARRRRAARDPEYLERNRQASAQYRTTPEYQTYRQDNAAAIQERMWGYHIKRMFNITPQQYQQLLDSQNGVCAICCNKETVLGTGGVVKRLAVDHCHTTGVVRGLLCDRCNRLLGYARESIDVLINAVRYLNAAYPVK